jgi:hypothetical protein
VGLLRDEGTFDTASYTFSSNLAHAAVDAELGASYEATFIGREEQRSCGDFLGFPHAPERDFVRQEFADFVARLL